VRPRGESAAELPLEGSRLAVDATDFFLLSAAERLVLTGGDTAFGRAAEFATVSVEAAVSGVAAAALSAGFAGAASWD